MHSTTTEIDTNPSDIYLIENDKWPLFLSCYRRHITGKAAASHLKRVLNSVLKEGRNDAS